MVNAAFARFVPDRARVASGRHGAGLVASLAAGALFHRWVETPLSRLMTVRPRPLRFAPIVPPLPLVAWRRV